MEQPAAAVQEQLLELEGEQEVTTAPAPARRSARGSSASATSKEQVVAAPAAATKGKRQVTIQMTVAGVRKQKAGSVAAAGKAGSGKAASKGAGAPELAAQRRGLRTSVRIRAAV